MRKDLLNLEARNNVSRNKKNHTKAALVGSSMAVFLLVGANNPVVASAEEIPSITQMASTSELAAAEEFITSMNWAFEAIVTIDSNDSDKDGDVTDLEAIQNDLGVLGESFAIQSSNIEAIKDEFANEIVTDAEAEAHLVPTLFLNLTAYETQAASDFTIVSDGETVTIGSEFIMYLPNIADQDAAEGIFSGGPLYVQNIDSTTGLPTGTIYEVDESFYYPIDESGFVGNEFYIPMTVDGVNGFTYFFKESGVSEITDSAFYGDTDGDGLLDIEEEYYGTDTNKVDTDGDGLTDGEEVYDYFTDPTMADSDSDGLNDYDEVIVYYSDPYNPDSDNDGLTDGVEVNQFGTDPNDPDTDGDGLIDGNEAPAEEVPVEDVEKPETLAYTGNTSHVGLIAGSIATLLFVVKKVIKL